MICTDKPSLLVGRRIVAFDPQRLSDGRGGFTHDPVVTLDNGATLTFGTEETDLGFYGTAVFYHPKRKGRK